VVILAERYTHTADVRIGHRFNSIDQPFPGKGRAGLF